MKKKSHALTPSPSPIRTEGEGGISKGRTAVSPGIPATRNEAGELGVHTSGSDSARALMRAMTTVNGSTSMPRDVMKEAGSFIHPQSLALIGATSGGGKIGDRILRYLAGWRGRLFLVSRSEREIMGRPACADIADLPDSIDLAVIAVEARGAVEAAKRCADKRFKALIIPASGFSETGGEGERLEEELRRSVAARGTRILGPNTLGVFIPGTGLDTVFVEHGDRMFAEPGDSVFITQSGSVGIEALGVSGVIGWGLRAFIGLGNRMDIGENEFVEYFAHDDRTRSMALYLETFQDGGAFIDICRRTTPEKPVIVLKAGRSEEALHAVASHTGKISRPAGVFTGAARQAGIILAQDEEQLTDFAKILSREPPAFDPGTAVVTFAGGYGIITLDLIADTLHLFPARLSERTVSRIRQSLPAFASADNPVDLTASADNGMMERTLHALEDDPNVGMIFCIAFFAPPKVDRGLIDILTAHRARTKKPFVVFVAYGPFTDEIAYTLYRNGVVTFTSLRRAVRAMDALAERGSFLKTLRP